jgi:hypothetical protein
MTKGWLAFGLLLGLAGLQPTLLAAQDAPTRTEQVRFDAGTTGASLSGKIVGRDFVTYTLGAEAGQRMTIALTSDNTAAYFNLYEPGRGPGDEALAIGEMLPEINRFDGVLPTSGTYTVSVFLYRNAARDGETAEYTLDISITGDTGPVVEGDYADGLMGGPDFWQVATTGGGTLKLHTEASTGSPEVARLPRGEVVRNLGCRMHEARQWCRVATLADPGFEGWAAAEFLAEAAPPEGVATQLPDAIPVPEGNFDRPVGGVLPAGSAFTASGLIVCVPDADAAEQTCEFGVVRTDNGSGVVTVFWPDGVIRTIRFDGGMPTGVEGPDAGGDMTFARDSDISIISIGQERIMIPDAVIFGG